MLFHARAQVRRFVHHVDGVEEQDCRLFLGGSRRINLSARLVICHKPEHSNAAGERRFAITFADFDIRRAEATKTISSHPSKEVGEDELLPGLQDERLSIVLTFGEAKKILKEFNDVSSSILVKIDRFLACTPFNEIPEKTVDGQPNAAAGQNAAAENVTAVLGNPREFIA